MKKLYKKLFNLYLVNPTRIDHAPTHFYLYWKIRAHTIFNEKGIWEM